MGSSRNPTSNSVLQAFLDARDSGLGTLTIDQAITRMSSDAKLRSALQAKWNAHAYPERVMEWAQLAKSQQLMTLSDEALKLLTFMGMYAHQSTLLQVSYKDLCTFTGIKKTRLRESIKELTDCGCIRIEKPSIRHAAPIYAVNPAIINKGTRRKTDASDFAAKIGGCPDYILRRDLPILVQQETVYQDTSDGGKVAFNRLRPVLPGDTQTERKPRRASKGAPANVQQIPGQMTFADFPEVFNG